MSHKIKYLWNHRMKLFTKIDVSSVFHSLHMTWQFWKQRHKISHQDLPHIELTRSPSVLVWLCLFFLRTRASVYRSSVVISLRLGYQVCHLRCLFGKLKNIVGHVYFAKKTSQNTVPIDLLWEKHAVPVEKISWKVRIIRQTNRATFHFPTKIW